MVKGGIPPSPEPGPLPDSAFQTIKNVQVIPPGYPAPEKAGRIYVTTQGDWWDVIAMRMYGKKRGNEHLMFRLLEANYDLKDVSNFPAGIPVNVPEIAVQTILPLVPWTSATFVPST